MKTSTSLFIFFCFLSTVCFGQANITTRFCLTGEYVELTTELPPRFNHVRWNTGDFGNRIIVPAESLNKTYSFMATCPHGCKKTKSITIHKSDFAPRPPKAIVTNVSCYKMKDGAIELKVYGGIGALRYEWSDGATTQNRTGLSGGVYSVTISDRAGCSQYVSVDVFEPALLDSSEISIETKDATCFDTATGSVKITTNKHALHNYDFTWDNGANTAEVEALKANTYEVIIKRDTFCRVEEVLVSQPDELIPNIAIESNYNGHAISCTGKKDGSVSVHITGGVAPYKLAWEQPKRSVFTDLQDTTLVFSNLKASTYIAIATDSKGCQQERQITLNEPSPIQTSAVLSQYGDFNISCRNVKDGSVTLNTSGGAGNYSFNWVSGQDTISTAPNLSDAAGGKYKVTITDGNDCFLKQSFLLKEPQIVDATRVVISEKEDQVTIKISPQGGTRLFLDEEGKTVKGDYTMVVDRDREEPILITDSNLCVNTKNWVFPEPINPDAIYGSTETPKGKSKMKPYNGDCPRF